VSVLAAALRLFTTRGYTATTIQAVAEEADVAVQTVYAIYGNKRELLRQVLEAAIAGDATADPSGEDDEVSAIANEPDARRRAEMEAAVVTRISRRIAPIMKVLREAATVDAEFAATAKEITARRRVDMASAAKVLGGHDAPHGDLEEAIGTLYVLYSPDVFLALTGDLRWSVKRYERWLANMLYRTLLT
jgi:AcrR family transcriptional regulator